MDHSVVGTLVRGIDGRQRVEMGPGEISFGEDKNTRKVDGKQGHRSGTLGDAPAVLMIVQLRRAAQARVAMPVQVSHGWV